jgi:hypothetical protein
MEPGNPLQHTSEYFPLPWISGIKLTFVHSVAPILPTPHLLFGCSLSVSPAPPFGLCQHTLQAGWWYYLALVLIARLAFSDRMLHPYKLWSTKWWISTVFLNNKPDICTTVYSAWQICIHTEFYLLYHSYFNLLQNCCWKNENCTLTIQIYIDAVDG